MKSLNNFFVSYIQNKRFGIYYLPARYQYVILRDYYNKHNQIFNLPQGEPVFTNTNIKLRSLIKKMKMKNELVVLSIYILPIDLKLRNELINLLIKKKIKTHFIFENIIAKNKIHYTKINDIIKLNKLIKNENNQILETLPNSKKKT